MFWQDEEKQGYQVPEDIVDLLFNIECRTLPVDHAFDLSTAIIAVAPWIRDDPRIGVHTVHLAGSQNGWERPDPALGQSLQLSRRTKLIVRVPSEQADNLKSALAGKSLNVGGHPLTIRGARMRPLSRQGTIFARYVVLSPGEDLDEEAFLMRAASELQEMGVRVRKALCGMTTSLSLDNETVLTRSLMIAGLGPQESVQLQERGLGPLRHMGCGIFIPHKGIDAVNKSSGDD